MAKLSTNLTGDGFLRDLASKRNTAVLEALWRAEEPGLFLSHIGATKDPRLGALVLNEYLAPRLPAPVPESILRVASSAQPPVLSRADASRLVERLRAEPPRQGTFPPARVHVEQWARAQDGPDVIAFAKEIASNDVPFSGNETVLNLARRRAMARPSDAARRSPRG